MHRACSNVDHAANLLGLSAPCCSRRKALMLMCICRYPTLPDSTLFMCAAYKQTNCLTSRVRTESIEVFCSWQLVHVYHSSLCFSVLLVQAYGRRCFRKKALSQPTCGHCTTHKAGKARCQPKLCSCQPCPTRSNYSPTRCSRNCDLPCPQHEKHSAPAIFATLGGIDCISVCKQGRPANKLCRYVDQYCALSRCNLHAPLLEQRQCL